MHKIKIKFSIPIPDAHELKKFTNLHNTPASAIHARFVCLSLHPSYSRLVNNNNNMCMRKRCDEIVRNEAK